MPKIIIALLTWFAVVPLVGAEDVWVAVGYGGRRMVSVDGKAWTITGEWAQPGGDDGNNLMSLVYGKGLFVAAGGGGAGKTGAGHILVSRDGREWKETHKSGSRINPVVFGNGRFVVGTSTYPSGQLLWSSDVETWTPGAKIQEKGLTHFRHGAFGNGVFVLVGNGMQKAGDGQNKPIHWAIVSADGSQITKERTDLKAHGHIEFGAGRFVMLSHEGILLHSRDGADWQEKTFDAGWLPRWLVWTGKMFLVGNHKGSFASTDGIDWKPAPYQSAAHVQWSDGTRFIATSWPGRMSHSADGKAWANSPPLSANGINRIVGKAMP